MSRNTRNTKVVNNEENHDDSEFETCESEEPHTRGDTLDCHATFDPDASTILYIHSLLDGFIKSIVRMQSATNQTPIETLRSLPLNSIPLAEPCAPGNLSSTATGGNFSKCNAKLNRLRDTKVLEAFLDAVLVYKECVDVSDEHALRGLTLLLEGNAGANSWLEAVARLRAIYGVQQSAHRVCRQIFAAEPKDSERAEAFVRKKAFEIEGMVAPVFTPIDDSGDVAYDIIPQYVEFLRDTAVRGILVGGTTGEAASLTTDERIEVFKAFLKVARPMHLKVIMQVGGAALPDVVKMAKCAEEMKADAIMTLPELYFKPKTTEQLVNYLQIVSSAAPSLPLLYYHFPMMSGVDMNLPEFFKLASKNYKFKGMKADMEAAIQVSSQLRKDQNIFIGNHLLAPAAFIGFDSSIATVTNLFPRVVEALIEQAQAGRIEHARQLQRKLNALVVAITSHGDFLPAMKAAMPIITGIKVGPPLKPLEALDPTKVEELRECLKSLNYGILN